MTDTFFNVNWYQKKIFRGKGIMEIHAILSLQNVFAKSKLIKSINPFQNFNSANKKFKSASARTSTKEVTNGLSPVKRAKRKRFSSSGEKCVMEKILRSFLPVLPQSSVLLSLLRSPAPTDNFVWARMWVMQDG